MTKLMITCLHDLISTENCLNENLKKNWGQHAETIAIDFFFVIATIEIF